MHRKLLLLLLFEALALQIHNGLFVNLQYITYNVNVYVCMLITCAFIIMYISYSMYVDVDIGYC